MKKIRIATIVCVKGTYVWGPAIFSEGMDLLQWRSCIMIVFPVRSSMAMIDERVVAGEERVGCGGGGRMDDATCILFRGDHPLLHV